MVREGLRAHFWRHGLLLAVTSMDQAVQQRRPSMLALQRTLQYMLTGAQAT